MVGTGSASPQGRNFFPRTESDPSSANLLQPDYSLGPTIQPKLRTPNESFDSQPSRNESPYDAAAARRSHTPSLASLARSDSYNLAADPEAWGSHLSPSFPEDDDELHKPDNRDRLSANFFNYRGLTNLGCIVILGVALLGLFLGLPLASHYVKRRSVPASASRAFNVVNGSGQIASMGNWGLIDLDTPQSAFTTTSYHDSTTELQLVFSDEFNTDGRSFYPGDDPYWEAVDLHYWQTGNLEWYDPEAITTNNGALEITLSQKENHGLDYQGGMITSWNKFCFTGGLVETSVTLPGVPTILGLWPAVWTMGNLGRAGYGASLEGMWPYVYDSCDVGTAPNQTLNGLPAAATINGDASNGGALSYLPGQRLSRCTCAGEVHPGPMHSDGTFVGRSAPEIDIFEAQIRSNVGQVSQSAQWGPFNNEYTWLNTSDTLVIPDPTISALNSYKGGAFQQATSVVTNTNQDCYQGGTGCFSVYGFEYQPGFDNAYITWITDSKAAWTLNVAGMAADPIVEISARPIPQEPMYIIANLGMSFSFGFVDLEHLVFPAIMRIDYIRVYQPKDAINIGCDPADFPTNAYINQFPEAYNNANLTTWRDDFKQPFPKNSFLGQC